MRHLQLSCFALLNFTIISLAPLFTIGTNFTAQAQVVPAQTPILIAKKRKERKSKSQKTQTLSTNIPQEMVNAHNQWRSKVGVTPLQWSDQLATYAQDWANQLAARGAFEHRPSDGYGENLFMGSGSQWSPTQVVDSWASEINNYNYATNSCKQVCGHYTQVVWANTTEVGCAVARSNNREIWVCNYNPPGNYIGQRPY